VRGTESLFGQRTSVSSDEHAPSFVEGSLRERFVPELVETAASGGFERLSLRSSCRLRLIGFTAHYGLSHRVGLVQAHSLESCVCENGSVSGESADGSSCPSVQTLIGE
jgi:hypothetical protein